MASTSPILSAVIDVTDDDADNTIITAPGANLKIRVLGYVFSVTAPGTVTWKSAATAKSGAMEFVDAGGATAPVCAIVPHARDTEQPKWFDCGTNELLRMTVTGVGCLPKGHVVYQIVPA